MPSSGVRRLQGNIDDETLSHFPHKDLAKQPDPRTEMPLVGNRIKNGRQYDVRQDSKTGKKWDYMEGAPTRGRKAQT